MKSFETTFPWCLVSCQTGRSSCHRLSRGPLWPEFSQWATIKLFSTGAPVMVTHWENWVLNGALIPAPSLCSAGLAGVCRAETQTASALLAHRPPGYLPPYVPLSLNKGGKQRCKGLRTGSLAAGRSTVGHGQDVFPSVTALQLSQCRVWVYLWLLLWLR